MNGLIALLFVLILTWVDGTAIEELSKSTNLFSATLYKELIKTRRGNIIVSPISAEIILALTQSAAKNETAEEIRSTLRLPNTDEQIQEIFKSVLPTLKGNEKFSLHTANKIYIKNSLTLKEQFKNTATSVYQAEVENIDFSQTTEAANSMNKWVERQTQNKIQNLINPDTLDAQTVAILINALHFKATWRNGFSWTSKQDFYRTPQDVIQIDTMFADRDFNYVEDKDLNAKFLELPFLGDDISMILALPNETDGITALENQIDKVVGLHDFRMDSVIVNLPKFRIESTIDLKKTLQKLGIETAFLQGGADFSGLVNEFQNLYVSQVIQKAFIDVDEKGVEAAAASFVDIVPYSRSFLEFKADHPFIFYIQFKGLILFVGRFFGSEQ